MSNYKSKHTGAQVDEAVSKVLNGEVATVLPNMVEITYSELVDLRDSSKLIPGQQYHIIDYVTTTTQSGTQSAGHQFDVIVTADDMNVLNENARAIQNEGDTYFANSDLNAWELKYCIDNDTNRFAWADTANGKGVIYRMIDEFGNDCPYDFKNIIFKHPHDETTWPDYYYTFHEYSNNCDHSCGEACSQNIIKPYLRGAVQYLNRILIFSDSPSTYIRANYFDSYCQRITSSHHFNFNYFHSGCEIIQFGEYCYNNMFGLHCNNIIFGDQSYNNYIGNNGYNIYLLGAYIINNYFEDNCREITLGSEDSAYYKNNHFCNGVRYCRLYSNETAAYEHQIQLLEISASIQGSSTSILDIPVTRGKTSQTNIAKNSYGVVKQFCLADIIQ